MHRSLAIAATSALSLAIVGFVACGKYEPPQDTDAFHAGFDWGPAHEPAAGVVDTDAEVFAADNFCDKCHIASVPRQIACEQTLLPEVPGGPEPLVAIDDPATGWSTLLSPLCQDCHPLVPLGQDPALFPCDPRQYTGCNPNDQSEYCRYINSGAHNGVNVVNGCDGAACHQTVPATSWAVGGGGPGEPTGHDGSPLTEIFPLDGGHANLSCSDCHADLSNAVNEAGQAQHCGNCHSREGEGQTLDHYPPDRDGWTDERERDCKACHANVTTGGLPVTLITPSSWSEIANDHEFRFPHNTVDDWDLFPAVTPNPETDWVNSCTVCHDVGTYFIDGNPNIFTGDEFDRFSCVACHNLVQLQTDYPAFHNGIDPNQPAGCNASGCHPSGTIVGDAEPN
jgi:hypothetical protein